MKKNVSKYTLLFGIVLFCIGVYMLVFKTGISYVKATADLVKEWSFYRNFSFTTLSIGSGSILLSFALAAVRRVREKTPETETKLPKGCRVLDAISCVLVGLNCVCIVISAIFGGIFYDYGDFLNAVIIHCGLYTVFWLPISILVGIVFNVISMIQKRVARRTVWGNAIMLAVFLLTVPIWMHFFWIALLSV